MAISVLVEDQHGREKNVRAVDHFIANTTFFRAIL